MNPDITPWSQWGIAGMLVGVIVLAAGLLLKSVLKSRDDDLAWYRKEYENKRKEYLASVEGIQHQYASRLAEIAKSFHDSVMAICERLERMENRVESAIRHVSYTRSEPKS